MKKISKILVIILTMILLISMLPIAVVNAAEDNNTGTIIVKNDEPTSNSSKYEVYKILKKTDDGYELTDNAKAYFEKNVTVTIGENTKYLTNVDEVLEYLNDLSNRVPDGVTYSIASIEAFEKDYKKNVTVPDIKTDENNIVKNEDGTQETKIENLEYGYYLIYDANGNPKSQNILIEVNKAENPVTVKAKGITVEKQATNGTSHFVGEDVEFTIKTAVPNMADYTSYTFKITDKPQNLDIDISSVKVSIGENDITKLLTGKITLTGEDKEKTLTVDLGEYLFTNKASLKEGDVILVTYKAKLTSDAIETSTATNDAQITYSNNPYADGEGEVTIPQGTEKVYTYSVTFNKKSSLGKDLSGAKFKLRILDGQYINIDKDSKVVTLVDEENASEFEGGTFTVTGLKAGTYELVETQAPSEDYKKAEGLIFTISNNDKSTIGTTLEDGVIITHTLSKDENADNLEIINGGTNLGVFEVNVINNRTLKSILLPSTGGIGTTIFAVIGIVLMISAVIALVVINKKSNK